MITEAHRRNYELYVKPYLDTLWPESLKACKEIVRRNLNLHNPKYDFATLKRISLGYIMQFAKSIKQKGRWDKSPVVINKKPRIVLSDIYIGMWYDDLCKEVQAEQAVHPMASQFLK